MSLIFFFSNIKNKKSPKNILTIFSSGHFFKHLCAVTFCDFLTSKQNQAKPSLLKFGKAWPI